MNRTARGLIFLVLVAAVACAACWMTGWYVNRAHHADHEGAHAWIHTQLGITPE
jgi:uncharacterized membrane-anchored protein